MLVAIQGAARRTTRAWLPNAKPVQNQESTNPGKFLHTPASAMKRYVMHSIWTAFSRKENSFRRVRMQGWCGRASRSAWRKNFILLVTR